MRSAFNEAWRGILWVSLFLWFVAATGDLIRTEWVDAARHAMLAVGFFYVISLERTLDRWEPFVPPSHRRRP